ncbi:MAG: radical SAM protein [Firmicutes bacterium]|nr:radical SAM protein [Bacillota bacterium]
MKKHAIIPIFISHRGCPHRCVFCNQKAITARSGDVSVSDAEKTIEEWLTTLEGRDMEIELSFFGGSFTGIPMEDQTAFLSMAKRYKDSGRIDKIHCSTRPDYINREILDNLKAYDMDVIELGVQSFDQKVLDASERGHSVKDVEESCRLIHEYGFTLGIQLMIGLPEDSYESCMESARKTIEMKPKVARLYPTVVIADTPLAAMLEEGVYIPPSEDEIVRRTKDMYKALTAAGINVIRIGLKSNELIKGDTYHPAIGQVVRSAVARDDIEEALEPMIEAGLRSLEIAAPPELFNYAVGHKADNKKYFSSKYPGIRFTFKEDKKIEGICVRKSE